MRLSSLTPAMVEAISVEEFREMGLRRSQAACVKTVASHFISGRLPAHLGMLDDIDVKNLLLNIKGIGAHYVFLGGHAWRLRQGRVACNRYSALARPTFRRSMYCCKHAIYEACCCQPGGAELLLQLTLGLRGTDISTQGAGPWASSCRCMPGGRTF